MKAGRAGGERGVICPYIQALGIQHEMKVYITTKEADGLKQRIALMAAVVFIFGVISFSAAGLACAADNGMGGSMAAVTENYAADDFIPQYLLNNGEQPITRAEFCQVLMNLYRYLTGAEMSIEPVVQPFTDTTDPAVLQAYQLGIVSGVGDGRFEPGDPITIEEKAVMLQRAMRILRPDLESSVGHDMDVADETEISPWAVEAVTFCHANQLLSEDENDELNPQNLLSRAASHEITSAAALLADSNRNQKNYLCYGYNVVGANKGYIDSAQITQYPILDKKKLAAADYDTSVDMRRAYITDTVSNNASDFYKQFNADANVSYSGVLFSGSVAAEYGQSNQWHTESTMIKHLETHSYQERYLEGISRLALKELLSEQFVDDVETMTPEDVFDKYGTHLITRYLAGGRIELSLKLENKSNMTEQQIKTAVSASYGKGSGSLDTDTQTKVKTLISNSTLKFMSLGGTRISGSNIDELRSQYNEVIDEMGATPDICMIPDFKNSMVPIWELFDGDSAAKLKAAFDKQVAIRQGELGKYVHKAAVEPFIVDIIVVADKDKQTALNKIPKNYKIVRINPGTGDGSEPLEANHGANGDHIYIAYLLGTDKSKAIGYIRVSEGEDTGIGYGYTRIPIDLNKGAGGPYLYLNYHRTDGKVAPLAAISGFYGTTYNLPAGWKRLPVNDLDLNKGTKKHNYSIYLSFKDGPEVL